MKSYITLLITLLFSASVCAQSTGAAYKIKNISGGATLIVGKTEKHLQIGDVLRLSDHIKLQSGSKITIMQIERPNKVFSYADSDVKSVYHIILDSSDKSNSTFREMCSTVVSHNKKETKSIISRPLQVERGQDEVNNAYDALVYSAIKKSIKDLLSNSLSKDRADVEISRTAVVDDEFSFILRKKSATAQYINILYVDTQGNYDFCFDDNILIDGKPKKDCDMQFKFDASSSSLTFMVIATSQNFDVENVRKSISAEEAASFIIIDQENIIVTLER